MTKKGFRNKFFITYLILSFGLYYLFTLGSGLSDPGQLIYAAILVFIPSLIIALFLEIIF